ncbi:VOC family protein [Empedobacter sedimenti]|uniref:VOC family protein n=1 Tax=Empedobacter sedimenti TaxID=3042610 RepID=UPI0024A78837|nr:VOC family protein [Empedobacter sedimenti]
MILRIARHTNKIVEIKTFYTTILNLEILGEFQSHNGYDRVFIGKPDLDWHLEFTTTHENVDHHIDEDDCLVFYPTMQQEYDEIIERLEIHHIKQIKSKNPYWNDNGVSFLDPDGFVVIVSSFRIK